LRSWKKLVLMIEISATSYRKAWQDKFEQYSHFYSFNIAKIDSSRFRKNYGQLRNEHLDVIKKAFKEFFITPA
jgi:hypothetical protein